MFIDTNEIEAEGRELDQRLEAVSLDDPSGEPKILGARVTGSLRPGPRGVELRALLSAPVRQSCCRCLDEFEEEIRAQFELVLIPDAVEFGVGEAEMRDEDVALYPTTDGKADLAAIVREQVYLNLPLKPICRADCQGLCPACGANRNRLECACEEPVEDPRLAPLLELKKRMGRS